MILLPEASPVPTGGSCSGSIYGGGDIEEPNRPFDGLLEGFESESAENGSGLVTEIFGQMW